MTDEANKPGKAKKKPQRRSFGQRETVIAGKKYRIRVFLSKDAVKAGYKKARNCP
jgi:hypothetical protein